MKRTHKIRLLLLLTLALCVAIACLCACTNGINGADGKDGVNGANGTDGKDGVNGANGKSAYEIWLDEGHTGSKADFLNWLKGSNGIDGTNGGSGSDGNNGLSAYEIFVKQYPYYKGTEEQWMIALVNGDLKIHSVTFKSEVSEDIVKYVVGGYALTDVPAVPEKEGQTSAEWNVKDFTNVTQNIEVNAVYDMRKYVTFHNDFADDEDITITVNYGEAIENVPEITAKAYNDSKWSVTDFSRITTDLQVEAIYETQGLQFTLIKQQTEYRISKGEMNELVEELFIPAEHEGKLVTVIDSNAFDYSSSYNRTIKYVNIPSTIREIREMAFFGCAALTDIQIPDNVTSIAYSSFAYCGLTKLIIPNSVTSIDTDAFSNCSNLTSIIIPDSVTSIGTRAFCNCSSLTSITIADSVTTIEGYAFEGCSNLTSIIIPDSVTSIGYKAFCNCSSLASIIIPDSVTIMGGSAFEGCSNLTSVYYMGDIASWCYIHFGGLFSNPLCYGANLYIDNELVTEIVIPDTVTQIESSAFDGYTSITRVTIGNRVTKIGWGTFKNCSSLTSVTIGNRVTSIDSYAFNGCSKLDTIYFNGTQEQFDMIKVDVGNSAFTDAMVYYYSETEPADNGNYWRYDTDGVTPIIWINEN